MNRTEFEAIRDIPGKAIVTEIRFSRRAATSPALTTDGIVIQNEAGADLRMNITYNPETRSKTFNVHVPGLGPICRLDVDGPAHGAAGRSHKHSLQSERCPDRNLPDGVVGLAELAGRSTRAVFEYFCDLASIEHHGYFEAPDE